MDKILWQQITSTKEGLCNMGELNKLGRFFDRKLRIIVEVQKHSHGFYYIHFLKIKNNLEPDLIEDERFINFENRFSKKIPNPCDEICNIGQACLKDKFFMNCPIGKKCNIIMN